MQYSYNALQESQIRLLKPERSFQSTNNPALRFNVVTLPRSVAPPYTAVSYVWGLGAANQKIILDGLEFSIRQNLWSCLHYLLLMKMHTYHETQWNHIWVDAICINQSDEQEKSQQVRVMDQVYSDAIEVNAWLGLQRLPNWIQWREDGALTMEFEGWELSDSIFDIAERSYWSRMWIVQELMLAKHIRLHLSDASFEFDDLSSQVRMMQASSREDLKQLLRYTEARELGSFHSQLRPPLHQVLLQFGGGQCSDPRDKVFALMSLFHREDQERLGQYFPDYSLTHDAVVAITLHHLQEHHRQSIAVTSHEIFESLGVSRSFLTRKRLLAASEGLWAFDDPASMKTIQFREIQFYDTEEPLPKDHLREDHLAEEQPRTEPGKGFIEKFTGSVWWFVTFGGMFRTRRNSDEQALLDFVTRFQEEAQAFHGDRFTDL